MERQDRKQPVEKIDRQNVRAGDDSSTSLSLLQLAANDNAMLHQFRFEKNKRNDTNQTANKLIGYMQEYGSDALAVAAGYATKHVVQRCLMSAPGWGKVAGISAGLVAAGLTKDICADGKLGDTTDWLRGTGLFGGSLLIFRGQMSCRIATTSLPEAAASIENRVVPFMNHSLRSSVDMSLSKGLMEVSSGGASLRLINGASALCGGYIVGRSLTLHPEERMTERKVVQHSEPLSTPVSSKQEIEVLIAGLNSDIFRERRASFKALSGREDAIPALVQTRMNGSPEAATSAEKLLGQMLQCHHEQNDKAIQQTIKSVGARFEADMRAALKEQDGFSARFRAHWKSWDADRAIAPNVKIELKKLVDKAVEPETTLRLEYALELCTTKGKGCTPITDNRAVQLLGEALKRNPTLETDRRFLKIAALANAVEVESFTANLSQVAREMLMKQTKEFAQIRYFAETPRDIARPDEFDL